MSKERLLWSTAFGLWVSFCIFLFFLPLSLRPASSLPDDGDALQATWMMAWVAHQLPQKPLDLFDANVYYPHPRGLAYSEHFTPQGVVVGLLQSLGCNLVLAYNLLAALTLLVIALTVRLLAREMGASDWGAAFAGMACALSTFSLEEVARLHILSMQWVPLGLYFLIRFFRNGSTGNAVGFALCFFLQGLSGHYYLISLPIFLGPLIIGLVTLFPERRNLRDGLRLALPLLAAGLLFIPIELPYLETFSKYRFRQELPLGTDLARFLVPPPNSLIYGWLISAGRWLQGANQHFLGYLSIALGIVGFAVVARSKDLGRRRVIFLWLGVLGTVFALFSAGKETWFGNVKMGPGLYRVLYDHIPFFNYARIPERLSVYFTLVFSLYIGIGASSLLERISSVKKRVALAVFLLVLLPLEHARIPDRPYPRIPTPEQVPEVYNWLASRPGDFPIAELPVYPRQFLRFYGYENYFSTFHWKRIPFGRPSFYPPALEYMLWSLGNFPSREATRLLQWLGIRYVIYHPLMDPHSDITIARLRRDRNYNLVRQFPSADPVAENLGYGRDFVFAIAPSTIPKETSTATTRVPRTNWRFETSSDQDPRLAVDGKPETSWSSGRPQEKGQFFEIDFGEEIVVSRISLGFIYPYSEFPRDLSINGYHRSHRWKRLDLERDAWDHARMARRLVMNPTEATLDLELVEPTPLERVRLFIPRTDLDDALPEWRIPEIWVYSPKGRTVSSDR